jgi:protein TonB
MKFEKAIPQVVEMLPPDETFIEHVPIFRPEVIASEEPVKQKPNESTDNYKEVPDTDSDDVFDKPIKQTVPMVQPVNLGDITLVNKPVEPEDVIFEKIEQVPIYPGCEKKKTNDEKRKCMSDKITQLIQKKFNTNLGSELGLSGKQVIRTQFKIDKTGHIKDIQVRGTHPDLEKEAERVINIIPEMTPGKQRDKNVGVIFTLPIVFQV